MTAVDRFRLVRAGILNLYEYGDQVFELAGGRLLLRGHNTSGKTKALELLLPFCLDGDISPRKLDPFAKAAKDMRWNLVGCIPGDQRTGYVWLEFERLSSEGTERVTGVIGMKANANVPGVKRWYAVVRGRRVGDDLPLRRGDTPLSKAELAAELGEDCPLVATATEYRRALNDAVFGFVSDDAYQTMLALTLELRRPHLSRALDPSGVTGLLTAALPEVDHGLIRRLGDGLEQLEDMRRALERLRSAHRRLERFVAESYGAYARAVLRERGDALRGTETAFENAARGHREARDAAEEAQMEVHRITAELDAARQRADRAEGTLTAVLQSPEWQSVEAVEQLARRAERQRQAAQTSRRYADHAGAEAVIGEAQEARSAADLVEAERELDRAREHLRQAAVSAGFGARHTALDEDLIGADTKLWRELAAGEVTAWRTLLVEQEQLLAEIEHARRELEHAKALAEAAELRLRSGHTRLAQAQTALHTEQERLAEELDRWACDLQELVVTDLDELLTAAADAGHPTAREPRSHWRKAAECRLREILQAQTDAGAQRGALDVRAAELSGALAELDAQVDRGPAPSSTRPADRSQRPGMPLWRAVEFAPALDPAAQAGLEAALEGAGLLDAWVTPDGGLLDPDTLDAVLVAGSPAADRTVADALQLAPNAPPSLRATLETIALVTDALSANVTAVDTAGGFALGPLRGRYGKRQAEHIGASARAAARERRRAELTADLERVQRDRTVSDAALAALEARARRLAEEEASFPATDAVATANREFLIADQDFDRLTQQHTEAAEATRRATDQVQRASAVAAEHAERASLPTLLTIDEVRTRTHATTRYEDGLDHAAAWVERVRVRAGHAAEDCKRTAALRTRAEGLERAAEVEATDARRLIAEHAEREAGLGAEAGQLRQRRQAVDLELTTARAEVSHLQKADKSAAVTLATAAAEVATAGEREAATRSDRGAALAAFARLERADVFRLALAEDAPDDHRAAADWTLTRALEVLRAIPADRRVAEAAEKLAASLTRSCSELDRDLAQDADMSVFTTVDADGVLAVRVRDGAAERSLPELTVRLAEETAERERTLSAEQRRVFGEALLEEIAAHLRARIHEVQTRVDEMNGILRHSATAAGKVVQLGWRPGDDAETAGVIPLIGKPASALSERDRETLVGFFRSRIELAQSAEIIGDDGDAAVRTLRDAFDYRRWFAFDLWEGVGRDRQRLTAQRHAVGSGGEQAVLVHLPLFAAAAALYSGAPSAPRLVMLDEALSGIDDDTRARVMGALIDLDLDFVMTSHELWGTYHTVPSLAVYQLYREQGLFGVHCERFVWDGAVLREEEQGELFRA